MGIPGLCKAKWHVTCLLLHIAHYNILNIVCNLFKTVVRSSVVTLAITAIPCPYKIIMLPPQKNL